MTLTLQDIEAAAREALPGVELQVWETEVLGTKDETALAVNFGPDTEYGPSFTLCVSFGTGDEDQRQKARLVMIQSLRNPRIQADARERLQEAHNG